MISFAAVALAVAGLSGDTSPVAAEVNGEVITMREVRIMAAPLMRRLQERYEGEALERKREEYMRKTVEDLVDQKLLVQSATEKGIEVADETVDARMEKLAEKVGGWPVLLDALAKVGMSFEDKVRDMRETIIVRRLLSGMVLPNIYASPSDVKRYYKTHKDEFMQPSEYRISQVIVWTSHYPSEEKLQGKIGVIRKELAGGADMAALARAHSDGPHARDGGDWGFVKPEDILKELGAVLVNMKVGEIKGPVETKVGFHFIKLTDVRDPILRPLADAYSKIEDLMRQRAYSLESKKYVRELRRKGSVRIHEEAIRKSLDGSRTDQ